MTIQSATPEVVSFPTADGGIVYADIYGAGERGVILAHGMRFDKASWKDQATRLANAGYLVAAIDFRGYGKSRGGADSKSPQDEMHVDVLAAARYLREERGSKTVVAIGASMGGRASANAVIKGAPGALDGLILLAHPPVQEPERIAGPKLFATAKGDPLAPQVLDQYAKAPEPKQLLTLEGDAHAQFLFATDQGERLMREILKFLSEKAGAAQ